MRTAMEMVLKVGDRGVLEVDRDLRVCVIVLDVREVFGRTDYLVSPVEGRGQKWVAASRVGE